MTAAAGSQTWAGAPPIALNESSAPTPLSSLDSSSGTYGYYSAWWAFTAPATDTVTFDTLSSTPAGGDTYLEIYTGADEASRVLVAQGDDAAGTMYSQLGVSVTAGEVYHILVHVFDSSGSGVTDYVLTVTGTTPPAPDATDTVNRLNGRTRVCEWSVTVDPPVAPLPAHAQPAHDYATATSLPEPTLVNGRPT